MNKLDTKPKKGTTTIKKSRRGLLIQAMNLRRATVCIRGTAPLIQHSWNEKSRAFLKLSAAERRKIPRAPRDPEGEGAGATYWCEDGGYGIPAMAVKCAMIEAAHKDIGLPKTTVKKALRFRTAGLIPLECCEPTLREDIVRVGINQTDIRYRPEFAEWGAEISFVYDADLLTIGDVVNLVNRAGFSIGIGEWRPECKGENGTFEVDPTRDTIDEPVSS